MEISSIEPTIDRAELVTNSYPHLTEQPENSTVTSLPLYDVFRDHVKMTENHYNVSSYHVTTDTAVPELGRTVFIASFSGFTESGIAESRIQETEMTEQELPESEEVVSELTESIVAETTMTTSAGSALPRSVLTGNKLAEAKLGRTGLAEPAIDGQARVANEENLSESFLFDFNLMPDFFNVTQTFMDRAIFGLNTVGPVLSGTGPSVISTNQAMDRPEVHLRNFLNYGIVSLVVGIIVLTFLFAFRHRICRLVAADMVRPTPSSLFVGSERICSPADQEPPANQKSAERGRLLLVGKEAGQPSATPTLWARKRPQLPDVHIV
jgi:hypothetical protein